MSDQDWKPVIINGGSVPGKEKNHQNGGAQVKTNYDTKFQNLDGDDVDPKKIMGSISIDLRLQIQKARTAKKMSQKELAQKLNVKLEVINQYESGKVKPDNRILQRMGTVLGVKFTSGKK